MSTPRKILFVVSSPGSGSTTQGQKLADSATDRGIKTKLLSPGDLFREALDEGPSHRNYNYAMEARKAINVGGLADDTPVIEMLINEIALAESDKYLNFVICGFPRTETQIDSVLSLHKIRSLFDGSQVKFLNIDVADDTAKERIIQRALKKEGGTRPDDEVVNDRFLVYHANTEPTIQKLYDDGLSVKITTDDLEFGETAWALDGLYGSWLANETEEQVWDFELDILDNPLLARRGKELS